ncbi:MAG: Mu transposase C-terminal domain-containing protein [Methylobacterium sp.]|uniref:Mu transposase C-terminal domain-containing protein n=1 Tax=Methylobacterium sp. TaxID=409 RepID=UPI0025D103FF|nr:Mu transposase C-terminal domain-containing protein [Methylobacterium sp.]MBX9933310.1 Mu transposase C-terminal domain-containing protein [Methylobacterium sp.]
MKEWLTAQEIATEALPQMPGSERAIQIMADRQGWNLDVFRARKRAGRGGGMEYHIGLLPTLAQVTYRQRAIPVGPVPESANVQPGAALSGRAAQERDARLAILRAFEAFARGQRLNQQGCEALFVSKYQAGTFAIEPWVRELVPSFSRRTLARWRAAAGKDLNSLGVDRGAARKGTGILETANDGAVRRWMLALITHQPHLSAKHIRRDCALEFGDRLTVVRGGGVVETIDMPPLRTFQAALKALKEAEKVVITQITNPDKFRSTMKLSGSNSLRHIDEPNALWMIDASPVDALCTDGRHSIYVCIDIATRRTVFYMSKTPRAEAVGLLLRKAILAWGVPAEIKTDNGSDFTAKASQRLLASLGIEAVLSDAFSPEQKGHVERVIGTLQRDCIALLPGFVGHSVADRKAIEGRKSFAQRLGDDDAKTFSVRYTAGETQTFVDAWADLDYAQQPHEALKRRTPAAVAEAAAHTIRRVDVRALDLLLAPTAKGDGTRTMTKRGIRIDGRHYLNGAIMVGDRVFVRHDPLDLGRVYLFRPDGETFVGEAVNAEFAGVSPGAFVQAQRTVQAEELAARKAAIEAERRKLRTGPDLAARALRKLTADRDRREAERSGVVPFPRPEVEHSTPAIAAALTAVTQPETPPVAIVPDRAAERLAQMREQVRQAPNVTAIRSNLDTPDLRFRRALELEARIAAGEAVESEEALQLGRYQSTPEYRARRKVHDRRQAEKAAL